MRAVRWRAIGADSERYLFIGWAGLEARFTNYHGAAASGGLLDPLFYHRWPVGDAPEVLIHGWKAVFRRRKWDRRRLAVPLSEGRGASVNDFARRVVK